MVPKQAAKVGCAGLHDYRPLGLMQLKDAIAIGVELLEDLSSGSRASVA